MASETLSFEITGNSGSATRAFRETADSAGTASRAARDLSDALDRQSKTAQVSAGAALAMAKADKVLRDAERELAVAAGELTRKEAEQAIAAEEATKQLSQQGRQAEVAAAKLRVAGTASASAGSSAAQAGTGFAALQSPMAAAVAAGVALSPVIVTVGTGLGGLGLAALSASKDTRAMHQVLGPLRGELDQFNASLKPEVLGLFGQGAGLASRFLKDIRPVASETGKALGGVLKSLDAEFASQKWQSFFGFMAQQAAPDVQQLGSVIVDLTNDLPDLLQNLQPAAHGLLDVADGIAKAGGLVGTLAKLAPGIHPYAQNVADARKETEQQAAAAKRAAAATVALQQAFAAAHPPVGTLTGDLNALDTAIGSGNVQLRAYSDLWDKFAGNAVSDQQAVLNVTQAFDTFSQAVQQSGRKSTVAQQAFLAIITTMGSGLDTLRKNGASVSQLNDFYTTNIARLQALHGLTPQQRQDIAGVTKDYLAWASAAQGLSQKVVTAAGSLRNNFLTAISLTHQLVPTARQDADAFANAVLKTGASSRATAADRARLIADLEHSGLSAQAAGALVKGFQGQISALHGKTVDVNLATSGSGQIVITGTGINQRTINTTTGQVRGPGGHTVASGWYVSGGTPGKDSVPLLAMPGELVVPTRMVASGAVDHLRGKIPGFAAGGVVGKVSAAESGIGSAEAQWGQLAAAAFATAAVQAAAKAAAASAAAPGFTGGAPATGSAAAAQAFARSILPAGWSWPALQSLWQRESGWNAWAVNPSSGAYGIPQSLGHGHPYNLGDYANQVRWGISYIAGRYGSSQAAWAHELSAGWYDHGGLLKPGLTLAYNGTGRPEQVIPPGGRSGVSVAELHVHFHAPVGSKAELKNWLVDGINEAAREGKLAYALRRSPSARP